MNSPYACPPSFASASPLGPSLTPGKTGDASAPLESVSKTSRSNDGDGDRGAKDREGKDRGAKDLVHFAGFWTKDDETVLRRAITHLELRLEDVPTRTLGEPWVCTCQIVGRGRFYTAHRAGFGQPVTGRSARQLSFRLYDAAHAVIP